MKDIMKYTLVLLILCSTYVFGQTIVPLYEPNIALRMFDNGLTKNIEYQEVSRIEVGNDLITYLDTRENFCVYSNGEKTDLLPMVNQVKTGETSVVFNSGPITFMFKDGKKKVLTNFGAAFDVSDSLIVFVNTFEGAVYARYNEVNHLMYSYLGDMGNSLGVLGENTFVFRNAADDYILFHQGRFTTLLNTSYPVKISAGLDAVAFNDPVSNTFAAMQDGQIVDVEDFHTKKYEAGHGFVAYEDINGNLKVFEDGAIETISTFPDFFEVKDSLVLFSEANMMKVYYNGKVHDLENFVPHVRAMKNGIIAYKNQNDGVTAFISGKKVDVTNEFVTNVSVNGHAVYFTNQNDRTMVYWKGRIYN